MRDLNLNIIHLEPRMTWNFAGELKVGKHTFFQRTK